MQPEPLAIRVRWVDNDMTVPARRARDCQHRRIRSSRMMLWPFPHKVHVMSPPIWTENLVIPPAALENASDVRSYYKR